MERMRLRKGFVLVVVTMLLVLGLALGMVSTVSSQSGENVDLSEETYIELEGEYIQQIRHMLKEEGYENCGINLTRVVDEEGQRAYRIVLHHKNMNKLSAGQQEELFEKLTGYAFSFSNCSFVFAAE